MDGARRLRLVRAMDAFLEACRRYRTWRSTDRLLGLLGGIADPELRLHRFGEELRVRSPEVSAWTIAHLWDRVRSGDRRAQSVCLGLLDRNRLALVLEGNQLEAIRVILEKDGDPIAAFLARSGRRGEAASHGLEAEAAPRPKEPVGFRISLARCPVPRLVDRLLFDPDPRVVRTILRNPRLTEAEVVKLAASRSAPPEVLEVIAQDDRWICRYPVKVALANNAATPLRVVLGLLPYLLHQDLRELAATSPSGVVREQAMALLSRRAGA